MAVYLELGRRKPVVIVQRAVLPASVDKSAVNAAFRAAMKKFLERGVV